MPSFKALEDKFALHKIFKLRQRYVLTRGNRWRLRYLACFAAFFVILLGSSVFQVSSSFALKVPFELAMIEPAAGDQGMSKDLQEAELDQDLKDRIQAHISGGIRKAALALRKPPPPLSKKLKIGSGDTLAGVLQEAGLSGADAHYAVEALSEHFDPRTIKPGQRIEVEFGPEEDGKRTFKNFAMKLSPVKEVTVRKDGEEEFSAELEEKELKTQTYANAAEIETSLYGSAARAGIPVPVIAEMIRIYSWDVDFQRDIRRGDKIEVLYEKEETTDGEFARYGDVLYASLSVGGKEVPIYRYEMKNGDVDYFEPDGHSIRKTLMKTPVDGARLSSGFGMRKHPILGYNKMHKGLDFAAPTGTPIYAAGDGTIEFVGRKGAYGNYIRIRHNSTLKTAYAHLHKYARGMSKGKRVEQGEVIGYVGSTGRSTGPHLHYEVHVNGKQKNPKSVDLPTGEQLKGKELTRFKGFMDALKQQYVALSDGLKFAQKSADTPG